MPPLSIQTVVYLILLVIAMIAGVRYWRLLSLADKIVVALLIATACQEISARGSDFIFHDNMVTYLVYTPLEMLLWSVYFNYTVGNLKKHKTGYLVGVFGVLAGIIIPLTLGEDAIFSYYILLEYTVLIIFCLLAFYHILMREDRQPLQLAQFWIVICLLFYVSVNFASYGFYQKLESPLYKEIKNAIGTINVYSNLLFYAGLAIVFFRYRKLIPSGA